MSFHYDVFIVKLHQEPPAIGDAIIMRVNYNIYKSNTVNVIYTLMIGFINYYYS